MPLAGVFIAYLAIKCIAKLSNKKLKKCKIKLNVDLGDTTWHKTHCQPAAWCVSRFR